MASKTTRAGILQQRRLMEVGAVAACFGLAAFAVGAVVLDRSVKPSVMPTAASLVPPKTDKQTTEEESYIPIPALIASGLSSSYKLQPTTPAVKDESGEEDPQRPLPPQDVALVAAVGQPGDMVAIIREGAAQSAIGPGQRAGSVEVLEVTPGRARIRHNGQEKELTIGQPMLLVSDIGGGSGAPPVSQAILRGEFDGQTRMNPDGTTTTTPPPPSTLQRSQTSGNRGGQGASGGAGGGSGNSPPRPGAGGGNNNNNQPAATGRPVQGQQQGQQQGAEDKR